MKLFRATKERPPLSPDRAAVRKKIEEYERLGDDYFSQNVEDDPPSRALQPDEVDYLCKKWGNKWNRMKARVMRRVMTHTGRKYYNIQVKGKENLRGLRHGGAIFTSNHFAFLENGAIEIASRMAPGRHRFHYVIREGNYFMDGTFGFLLQSPDHVLADTFLACIGLAGRTDALHKALALFGHDIGPPGITRFIVRRIGFGKSLVGGLFLRGSLTDGSHERSDVQSGSRIERSGCAVQLASIDL